MFFRVAYPYISLNSKELTDGRFQNLIGVTTRFPQDIVPLAEF